MAVIQKVGNKTIVTGCRPGQDEPRVNGQSIVGEPVGAKTPKPSKPPEVIEEEVVEVVSLAESMEEVGEEESVEEDSVKEEETEDTEEEPIEEVPKAKRGKK